MLLKINDDDISDNNGRTIMNKSTQFKDKTQTTMFGTHQFPSYEEIMETYAFVDIFFKLWIERRL